MYKKANLIRESLYTKLDFRLVKNYMNIARTIYYHNSNKIESKRYVKKYLNNIQNDKKVL